MTNEITEIDKLKNELNKWNSSLKIRLIKRIEIKNFVNLKINELKKAKHTLYLCEKEVKEARIKCKYYESKIKRHPIEVRRWGKNNLGKVISFLENRELK